MRTGLAQGSAPQHKTQDKTRQQVWPPTAIPTSPIPLPFKRARGELEGGWRGAVTQVWRRRKRTAVIDLAQGQIHTHTQQAPLERGERGSETPKGDSGGSVRAREAKATPHTQRLLVRSLRSYFRLLLIHVETLCYTPLVPAPIQYKTHAPSTPPLHTHAPSCTALFSTPLLNPPCCLLLVMGWYVVSRAWPAGSTTRGGWW